MTLLLSSTWRHLNHFPLLDETLRHIELCTIAALVKYSEISQQFSNSVLVGFNHAVKYLLYLMRILYSVQCKLLHRRGSWSIRGGMAGRVVYFVFHAVGRLFEVPLGTLKRNSFCLFGYKKLLYSLKVIFLNFILNFCFALWNFLKIQ